MIVYHPAFDFYHTIYRILQLLTYFQRNEYVEVDRLRIWDFYFLFPSQMLSIKLKENERDIRIFIKKYIAKKADENPYEIILDNKKMFNKMERYQVAALKNLASHNIINVDYLSTKKISLVSIDKLKEYTQNLLPLSIKESNTIKLLTSHFYQMPLNGKDGLKERTNLIESKYDA